MIFESIPKQKSHGIQNLGDLFFLGQFRRLNFEDWNIEHLGDLCGSQIPIFSGKINEILNL